MLCKFKLPEKGEDGIVSIRNKRLTMLFGRGISSL